MLQLSPIAEMHLCSQSRADVHLCLFEDVDVRKQKMGMLTQSMLAHGLSENYVGNDGNEELHLIDNHIGPPGAAMIADALRTNTELKHLGLNNNPIGDAGATELADALCCDNGTLQSLYLTDNDIGDLGVFRLADALRCDTACRLQTLLLAYNYVGGDGARALADALRTNTTLRTLVFAGASLGEKALTSLHAAIGDANCTLETLHVADGFGSRNQRESWERSFQLLLAPAARAQRKRKMAWKRRANVLLCLYHAAGRLAHQRVLFFCGKKTVLLPRGAFGNFLAAVPSELWPGVLRYL